MKVAILVVLLMGCASLPAVSPTQQLAVSAPQSGVRLQVYQDRSEARVYWRSRSGTARVQLLVDDWKREIANVPASTGSVAFVLPKGVRTLRATVTLESEVPITTPTLRISAE